jgi:hypothetical protein
MEDYESLILELKNEFQRELFRVHETYQIQIKNLSQEKDELFKVLLENKMDDSFEKRVTLEYSTKKSKEPLKESTYKFTNKSSVKHSKMDDSLQTLLDKIK